MKPCVKFLTIPAIILQFVILKLGILYRNQKSLIIYVLQQRL